MRGWIKLAAMVGVFFVLAGAVGAGRYMYHLNDLMTRASQPDGIPAALNPNDDWNTTPYEPTTATERLIGGTAPGAYAQNPRTGERLKPGDLDLNKLIPKD